MKGHGEKYSQNKDNAVLALLQEPTIEKAAARCGISEVTLWRWQQRKDFQEHYQAARLRITDAAIAQIQQASVEAVEVLRDVMKKAYKNPAARVSAAKIILEIAFNATELNRIEDRLTELEEKIG